MEAVQGIQSGLVVILVTMIAFFAIVAGVFYYLVKVRKIAAAEETIDYNSFRRVDATEYCKFKDVITVGGEGSEDGMISMGNNVFVGGIDVRGYHYYAASAEERQATMRESIVFFSIVEHPVQLRQTVQAVNISRNIEQERQRAKDIERKYLECDYDYRSAVETLELCVDDPDVFKSVENRVKQLLREKRSLEWKLREANELVHYMEEASSVRNTTRIVHQVLFSYKYDPSKDNEDLSDEEIYQRAYAELETMAKTYGGQLESCGCSWSMLTADDLVDLIRKHYHPATGDEVPIEELLNSSYKALYVTSNSLWELEQEKQEDIAYREKLRALQEEQEKEIESARLKSEAVRAELMKEPAPVV